MKKTIEVKIDNKQYTVENELMLGSELKEIADIPIDKNMVIKVNNAPDVEVLNNNQIVLHNGMRFISEMYICSIEITIDGKEVILTKEFITGAELKSLAGISSADYKLIKEVKDSMDMVIEDNATYEIEKHDMFFTMPSGINNGGYNYGTAS
ncbi:MAG: multiubiquitin domain-containing protein [Ruminiclostridium sp.]|nr:multiubiquitin domain-containing protein [Ruminiclostridium sp.]